MNEILTELDKVWGGHNDFEEGGWKYVVWLIRQNLKDIEEYDYAEEVCVKEFADIMLICIRHLDEQGYVVKNVILERLRKRMKGKTKEIIHKYRTLYRSLATTAKRDK